MLLEDTAMFNSPPLSFSLSHPHTENALLEDDNTFHLVRPADEIDEVKSKRGSMKGKTMTKAITEIYLTRLLSVKVHLSVYVCSPDTVLPL